MKYKTFYITVSIFALLVILILFAYLIYLKNQNTYSRIQKEPTGTENIQITKRIRITLENSTEGKLSFFIEPQNTEEISVSAFELLLGLTPDSATQSELLSDSLEPNPSLKSQGWTFPINSVEMDKLGKITLKISGYKRGSQGETIKGKLLLGSVMLTPKGPGYSISELNSENTKFFAPDMVTLIPAIAQ